MWQGLQTITDYKKKTSPVTDIDIFLLDKLNNFVTHFEDNTVPPTWPATKDCGLSFSVANLSKTFKRVNSRRAAGPGGIPSHILRACADQLAGVFTDIFNQSLSQSAVPTCFKMATVVPCSQLLYSLFTHDCVPRYTYHRQTEMVHAHRQCGEEDATAPLQPQEAKKCDLLRSPVPMLWFVYLYVFQEMAS